MKTSRAFYSADPSVRTDMVLQGFSHLSAKIRLVSIEMNILNQWLKDMPGLLANDAAILPDNEKFTDTLDEFLAASDSLTESMIDNALNLEEMSKAIRFYRKYGSSTM